MIRPEQFGDLELAKRRAANIRHKTINKLDSYLIEFTRNFENRGGKVLWAPSDKDAQKELISIIKKQKNIAIAGIKSEITAELDIRDLFIRNKRDYIELDPQNPGITHVPEQGFAILTAFMLVADSGIIVLADEYGNMDTLSSGSRIRIILAGIEDIIPSVEDLELFLSLKGPFAYNNNIPSSVKILSGPFDNPGDEPSAGTFLILVDNHRTEVLKFREQRKALWCIHCRACDKVCPIGERDHKMPVQAVTEPFLHGFRDYHMMSFSSTLCGACTVTCPVKIPLHELLLHNRREAVLRKHISIRNKRAMNTWKYVMLRRWILDKSGPGLRNYLVRSWLASATGGKEYLPRVAAKTFKEMWKEERFPGQDV